MIAYLDEFNLEIDDIRWHLCQIISRELLSYEKEPRILTEMIWSGNLADKLHNLEEKHLETLVESMEKGVIDDAQARLFFLEARAARRRRMGR